MIANEGFILVGDESSSLSVFDPVSLKRTHHFENVHDDFITSINALYYKNKYHFVTSGSTTVAHIDIRKGILSTSEDQEDEILCGALTSEKSSAFGMSEGVLTLWNDAWQDQQNRVKLSEESIDCIIPSEEDFQVYASGGDGSIRLVNVRNSKILDSWQHADGQEEVINLDLDFDYRPASVSMETVKLWSKERSEDQSEPVSKRRKGKSKSKQKIKQVQGIASFQGL